MKPCFFPGGWRLVSWLLCVLLAASPAAALDELLLGPQTVIAHDTFDDGERATQNLPQSLQWLSGASTNTVTVSNGELVLTLSGGRHMLAYIPEQTLEIGEGLELSFDFRVSSAWANQGNGFRFALLHTNGNSKFVADNHNNDSAVSYIGYAVTTNGAPSSSNPTVLRERTAAQESQLITSLSSYTALSGGSGGPVATFATGTTYRATLIVERIDTDSVRVTGRYTGGSLPEYEVTTTDPSEAVVKFDTLVIAVGSSGGNVAVSELTVDNVSVIHYGVPPPTPPTITTQPTSTTVLLGGSTSFTVEATGSVPMTFQWYHNDVEIPGANSATLALTNVQASQAGNYTVKITNAGGEAISDVAVLTVDTAPVAPSLTLSPFSQTVVAGTNVTLHARATGSLPLSYQWLRNGVPIPGADAASLALGNVDAAKAGAYTVMVTNSVGSVTSTPAVVTVAGSLASSTLLNETFSGANFTTQNLPSSARWLSSSTSSSGNLALQSGALLVPAGRHALAYFTDSGAQSLAIGEQLTATFNVNFSIVGNSGGGLRMGFFNSNGATRPLGGDNASFGDYSGFMLATTARYPDDNGATSGPMSFRLRNVGSGGALISTTGNYGAATNYNGNNQSFETGVNYTFKVTALRRASDKLLVTLEVTGGSLAPYGFQHEATTTVGAFDCFAILSTSTNGSTFTIDNVVVAHTAAPAAVAPSILAQPESASVSSGDSVTFTVDAIGTPVPTFQWRKGGVEIEGATNASYTIESVTADDAGDYDVVVTNSVTSVASQVATLTVATPYSALESWRLDNFGSAEGIGAAADLADPDGDGLVNLVEYALDFDPLTADAGPVPAVMTAGGEWVFSYTRPVNRSDLSYFVEVSTDLTNWTTDGVTHEEVAVVGETATWQARHSQASTPVLFFRLRVAEAIPE